MDDLKARPEKWIRIEEWEKAQAAKKDDKGNVAQNNKSC
jgi:hypothetical protein